MPTLPLDQAYAQCTALAESHYENFPVGCLVPKALRHHVHAVYAFARQADDLADEGYAPSSSASEENLRGKGQVIEKVAALTPEQRLAALDAWENHLLVPPTAATPPTFLALHDTIRALRLPLSLFTDLISAFKQDVVKSRYPNFPEVLDYCRRSANPIGRLVLLLHGYRDPALHHLSDFICTALQLANFWQDVAVDLDKDRIYLPLDDRCDFGVSDNDLTARRCTDAYRRLLRFQVERTQRLFDEGSPLPDHLEARLAVEIRFTWLGGTTILRKIEDQNYDTLSTRPKLSKRDFLTLLPQALIGGSV
jgi:squalene synthase HpnC